ncbi:MULTISPECIES: hypothetical protein [Actinosynnema]|uniref:hypothetical protein n=1 Tax=Actinosynnema TaxID=40566 RepID=UPI0020A26539|nr:hypothetical protein [Actinosynnema pretiosum]MCP2098984.1 hypothetical protein [Actinosynnema pretiosum]
MNDRDTITRLTEARTALDAARDDKRALGHVGRTRLEACLGHLDTVLRGVDVMLSQCANGALKLAEDADAAELVQLAHEFERTVRATTTLCKPARTALRTAHSAAWTAHSTREPEPGRFGLMVGENVVTALDQAALLLSYGGRPVTTAAAQPEVVAVLWQITERTAELLGRCADATHELASNSTTTDAAQAHRATNRAIAIAFSHTVALRRALDRVHPLASDLDELAARTRRS